MRQVMLLSFLAGALYGQTTVILRTAIADTNFSRNSLYAEVAHQRGRSVVDCGYHDSGNPKVFFSVFCGAGRDLSPRTKRFSFVVELVAMRSSGQSIITQYHLLPYTLAHVFLSKKKDVELVGYAGIPINSAAKKFMEIERFRFYHNFGRVKVGFGYAATKSANQNWVKKPFFGVAIYGFEVWPQAIIQNGKWGWQLQLRYAKTFR